MEYFSLIAALCLIFFSAAFIIYTLPGSPSDSPNSAPTVPYTIPWIGSFFSFNKDPIRFLEDCNSQFGKCYKIHAAGRTVAIFADADSVSFISRDTTSHLDHKGVFIHILRAIGGHGSESVDFIQDLLDTKIFPIVKTELSPTSMSDGVARRIDSLLPRELSALSPQKGPSKLLNLSEVIGRPLYNAGCQALFGPTFPLESFPDFVEMDQHLPQLLTRLPFVARRGKLSRNRLIAYIEDYIASWWASDGTEDIFEASTTVMMSLIEFKASGISRRDAAGAILLFLWGFHSNMWFMIFWLLTHLMANRSSMTALLADIDAFKLEHSLEQLDNPEFTPSVLESAIQETFRWATTSTTARLATENTSVPMGGIPVFISKGEWIVGDIRAVHHNPAVYDDPNTFKVDRYTLTSPPKPSPWGQGRHMCPGRHIAAHIIRRFVVELLTMYKMLPAQHPTGNLAIPPISSRHFLGSLKSAENVPVILSRI